MQQQIEAEQFTLQFTILFMKISYKILNIFQQKLEMVKSNADNSHEVSYYQGFEKEGYLRQIEQDHQILFLNLAVKAAEIQAENESPTNIDCIEKAINLDKTIKLINEELSIVSERQAIQSQQILNYLTVLGKLMNHKDIFSKENQ